MLMRTDQLGSSIHGDKQPGNSKTQTENTQASSLEGGGIQIQQGKEMLKRVKEGTWIWYKSE